MLLLFYSLIESVNNCQSNITAGLASCHCQTNYPKTADCTSVSRRPLARLVDDHQPDERRADDAADDHHNDDGGGRHVPCR